MYNLARLRGTALVLAAVVLGLGILAASLWWATNFRPGWFPSLPSKMDVASLHRAGELVALAARDSRRDPRIGDGVGVIFGASSMHRAIDPALLAEEDGDGPARWMDLSAPDASLVDLERIARLLGRGGVRPSVAVVGINLGMLATSGDLLADAMLTDPAPIVALHLGIKPPAGRGPARLLWSLGRLAGEAKRWVRPQHMKFNHIKSRILFEWRVAALMGAGAEIDEVFRPASAYWVPPGATEGVPDEAADEEVRLWQFREFTRRRWFSAGAYGPDGPNIRALADLLAHLRLLGARVVLLLLPEPTRLRERIPPEASQRLRASIADLPPDVAPEVLDLGQALDDSQVGDLVHLTPSGRRAVTLRLARLLAAPDPRAGGRGSPPPGP